MPNRIELSKISHEKIEIYKELLIKWNKKINLISADSVNDIYNRHILDGIELAYYITEQNDISTSTIYDLGSGNGVPGVILSFILDHEINVVESDQRKCAFLEDVKFHTKSSYNVLNIRAEQLAYDPDSVIVARGFASVKKISDIVSRETDSPRMILLKGQKINDELIDLSTQYGFVHRKHHYLGERVILDIKIEKK